MCGKLARNPRSAIFDHNRAIGAHLDANAGSGRRVLDGVLHEIAQCLANCRRITTQNLRRTQMQLDFVLLRCSPGAQSVDRFSRNGRDVEVREFRRLHHVHPREHEQPGNAFGHACDVGFQTTRARMIDLLQLEQHHGQGRTQLMGGAGDEDLLRIRRGGHSLHQPIDRRSEHRCFAGKPGQIQLQS